MKEEGKMGAGGVKRDARAQRLWFVILTGLKAFKIWINTLKALFSPRVQECFGGIADSV